MGFNDGSCVTRFDRRRHCEDEMTAGKDRQRFRKAPLEGQQQAMHMGTPSSFTLSGAGRDFLMEKVENRCSPQT